MGAMIDRRIDLGLVRAALRRSRIVALLGPRQCGKTTLARQLVPADSLNYFDLEDPQSLARLTEPDTALRPLKGLVVIDEVQRRPELFPLLRVLADRTPLPARVLVLGSASPDLLKQSSEKSRQTTGESAESLRPRHRSPAHIAEHHQSA
jgi:predicted AAA+ superfamily ATPase